MLQPELSHVQNTHVVNKDICPFCNISSSIPATMVKNSDQAGTAQKEMEKRPILHTPVPSPHPCTHLRELGTSYVRSGAEYSPSYSSSPSPPPRPFPPRAGKVVGVVKLLLFRV